MTSTSQRRQFTLMVDGRLRTYDHPPEPPGYSYEQLMTITWIRDWLREQQRKRSAGARPLEG